MYSLAEHFGAEQQTTKLMLGNKSERAQKVFALDYCSGAFVTEGAASPPAHSCSRPEHHAEPSETWAAPEPERPKSRAEAPLGAVVALPDQYWAAQAAAAALWQHLRAAVLLPRPFSLALRDEMGVSTI